MGIKTVSAKHQRLKKSTSAGFSLVELLVVVAVLAILAAIAIPLFLNQRSKAAQGAVQSDARNLATNLTTLFTNLPRSADPNVALNGGTAPNTTLSGSGTIAVGGETLNVNLSPDVIITKTGNADPADGAGLKITHAGVENWACVIPLPPSVAYAQTSSLQQTCGTVISEQGNLLTLNQSTFALGTTTGWTSALNGQLNISKQVPGSAGEVLTLTTTARAYDFYYPNSARISIPDNTQSLTVSFRSLADTASRNMSAYLVYWNSSNQYLGETTPQTGDIAKNNSNQNWVEHNATFTSIPADTTSVTLRIMTRDNTRTVGEIQHYDSFGVWVGNGGVWQLPGVPIVQP